MQSGALHGEEAGEIGRKGKAPEEGIQGEESEGEESQRAGFDEKTRGYARSLIEEAMEASGGNQGKAAKLLGLTYHKFRAIRRKLFPKSE